MNCGVLRPQIASLWSMVTRLSVLDLVKIGRGYWLYLHERIHMQYVSRHKLSLCDLSNIVSFWHNELWCPPTTNKLSVTFYPSNSTQKYCPKLLFFYEIKKIILNIFFLSLNVHKVWLKYLIFLSWIWGIKGHREFICGRRTPQFIVSKAHNIWKVTEWLFFEIL